MTPARFRKIVLEYYRAHGRHHLPWRKTRDPYRILVSEVMLQQTQVDRVIPFYTDFIRSFPTVQTLAQAPLAHVLRHWQGLGYNRRAKMLHEAAKHIEREGKGRFPRAVEDIEALPGVGPYTARAVAVFAYGADEILVETNTRAAIIHHFPKKTGGEGDTYSDPEIRQLLEQVRPIGTSREWNSALMDYGAALKRQGVRTNALVKGYAKQKRFDGSLRQARGAILRALLRGPMKSTKLTQLLGREREVQMKAALASLTKEGLVEIWDGQFRLPGERGSVSKATRKIRQARLRVPRP